MKSRLNYLDVLRVFSVGLVMYGHFVMVAGGAKDIPNIVSTSEVLPIIDESTWRAYLFEIVLIKGLSTQAAVFGVSLFFLITGYLMPLMCEQYARAAFLANRVFRIFPTLAASLMLLGGWLYLTQGIEFSYQQYLSSLSLSFFYIGVPSISGVLWTLAIEIHFYVIAFLVGRFTLQRLLFVQGLLLGIVLAGTRYSDVHTLWIMGWQARYLLLISIGSAIYLAEKEAGIFSKVQIVLPSLIMSYLGFQLFKFGHVDASTYETVGTHMAAVTLFLAFQMFGPALLARMPRLVSWLADLVYPLYLVHAAIGLSLMVVLRRSLDDPYALLLAAVVTSVVLSWLLHILVENPAIQLGRTIVRGYFPVRKVLDSKVSP